MGRVLCCCSSSLVAGVFLGQLGPVLIPIRPGDERDVRPIKHPAAERLVYLIGIKSGLMQPAYGLHESVTRWHDLASSQTTNNKLLNPSSDIGLY